MKKESVKKLKDGIPYLIVAQTVMLGTITMITIVGSLSKSTIGCRVISSSTLVCIQK
jgi:hypothetical protein